MRGGPGDVDALVAALRRLIDDPDLRARLATAAVARAADFEPDVIGAQMRALYEGLLSGRSGRRRPRRRR